MMTATYFGEITELESRAVWYSDEESDADDENEDEINPHSFERSRLHAVHIDHESIRSNLCINFKRLKPDPRVKITSCILSLASTNQFKNFKLYGQNLVLLGMFGDLGKVFLNLSNHNQSEGVAVHSLWLVFDSNNPVLNDHRVSYLVEILREQLFNELNVEPNGTFLVLSQQFSKTENLEYLSNYSESLIKPPFRGQPILPPALISNKFESALFEQFTLALKQAYIVCLPDPKNFWFDKAANWPNVADVVIDLRLNDDHLEKTLIFT